MNLETKQAILGNLMHEMCNPPITVPPFSEECCPPSIKSVVKKESDMYADRVKTIDLRVAAIANQESSAIETGQRNHARGRLRDLRDAKDLDLRKQFGLDDDASPKSPKELAKRIADGKFVIKKVDEDMDEEDDYFYWQDAIRWRDPAVKEDKVGYKAATTELGKSYQRAKDQIILGTVADSLKVLQDFESGTIH
jgi:hypothetical protein